MNNKLNYRHTGYAHFYLILITVLVLLFTCPVSAVVIDNDQIGTSSTGTWQISGGSDPYGSESLWSRSGATYTWTADSLPAGQYRVFMWWTEWPSRTTAVPIRITHADDTTDTTINQQINGGQWNSIGEFYFDGVGSVQLSAPNPYPTSYCADAVQFTLLQAGPRPVAVIDSITPSPAASSEVITFIGHGTDNGTIVDAQWESNIDGILGNGLSLDLALSDGVHTISFRVQDDDGLWSVAAEEILVVGEEPQEFIIDNGQAGTSSTGTWQVSGGSDPFGDDSLWSRDGGTYTWSFTPPVAGDYEVFMWWTEWPSRTTDVPVQITHTDGVENTTVNQQENGGDWNSLGIFYFDGSGSVQLSAPNPYPTSYCADAIKFTKVNDTYVTADFEGSPVSGDTPLTVNFTDLSTSSGAIDSWQWDFDNDGTIDSTVQNPSYAYPTAGLYTVSLTVSGADGSDTAVKTDYIEVTEPGIEVIIDNDQSGTSSTGTWLVSGASDFYGTESLWSRDGGTYTWSFTPPVAGSYQVSMWWTEWPSRATDVPVQITHADGVENTTVNQQENGGDWNSLGIFNFDGTGSVRLSAPNPYPTSYCADAVKFTKVNDTYVTADFEGSPLTGDAPLTVNFTDLSTSSGAINLWQWDFDNDGTVDSTSQNPAYAYTVPGVYTVSLTVSGADGSDTAVKTDYVHVTDPGGSGIDLILDNGEPGTTSTGTWSVSGAPAGYYGDNSLWSRNGATYTWSFDALPADNYEVYMWWTEWSSRSTAAPVAITHALGTTNTTINQQVNGGQWSSLGKFYFNGTADVSLAAPDVYTTSYCADAVRIVAIGGTPIPVANIVSINPLIANIGENVSFVGEGTDAVGTITAYEWTSSLDGIIGNTASFTTDTLSEGTHEIGFRVRNNSGVWSSRVTSSVEVFDASSNIEYVFCCFGYYTVDQRSQLTNYLNAIGDYQGNDVWRYVTLDKTYIISYVDTLEGMKQALRTPDSHILYSGHSNYGLGPLFATPQEFQTQTINNVYYVNDPRILNLSSEYVHLSVSGMRTGQAYPYWWPIYQDGTSALAPYTFNDPAGDPAYNYYVTYQVPGDPTYYMVDTDRNPPVERYWGTGVEPWYSPTGEAPNPDNPAHQQYFVVNYEGIDPSIDSTGTWTQSQSGGAFFKENYWYSLPGNGENEVNFLFDVREEGDYDVFAWWPDDNTGTTAATYTVHYESGSDDVVVDQSTGGGWYLLGRYPFTDPNKTYSVTLNNDVASGRVLADAIKVAHPDNPPDAICADFEADNRFGPAPLVVEFDNESIGDLTGRRWNFGDGYTNSTRDEVVHTYTSPGFYTVSLTATGPAGNATITKTDYIWVTNSTEEPFQVDFSARSQEGSPPRYVRFRDESTGDIASWLWDFGDGTTSTEANPTHTYTEFGNYDVSLTVTEAGTGNQDTIIKENFVMVASYQTVDNVDYPLPHFTGWSGKNVVHIRPQDYDVPLDEVRCKRAFYYSCNSGNYYLDVFKDKGAIVFYTLNLSDMAGGTAFYTYLYGYFNGRSDDQILQSLEVKEASADFDYWDFSKRPDEQ